MLGNLVLFWDLVFQLLKFISKKFMKIVHMERVGHGVWGGGVGEGRKRENEYCLRKIILSYYVFWGSIFSSFNFLRGLLLLQNYKYCKPSTI